MTTMVPEDVTVEPERDDDDGPVFCVTVALVDPDGVHHVGLKHIPPPADADALADAIVAAATGCAATYGSDLWFALAQRMVRGQV